jgi:tyrosyl-tRNA synthetase
VVTAGLAASKSEARRLIEQGAVYVNGERATDVARKLGGSDWPKGHVLLRKGKKDYALLRAG